MARFVSFSFRTRSLLYVIARLCTMGSAVAPGTFFMTADYVNLTAFETKDGLVLVDCGMEVAGPKIMEEIRKLSDAPLHTVE